MVKVLVVGSGGRENGLGWIIGQDNAVTEVLYAPGNAGTEEGKSKNLIYMGKPFNAVKKENFPDLLRIIEKEGIDMVVVGPEDPLNDGIVDDLNENGYKSVIGPTRAATALEADKFFSFNVMQKQDIPQAEGIKCYSTSEAEAAIRKMATDKGVVIKARGLTAGKGVTVCDSEQQALEEILKHSKSYGPEVLISERLFGEEYSMFAISDGENVKIIDMMFQDHKPLLNGDHGPNTGGMGAYGPAMVSNSSFSNEALRKKTEEYMSKVVRQMKAEGREYKGFLYAGMMLTKKGPRVIEFNARFGDPECQPAMMMLNGGMYGALDNTLKGDLDKVKFDYKIGAALCAVLASNGYPGDYSKGLLIGGLQEASELEGIKIFHAGTSRDPQGRTITAGGRVLGVTAYAATGIKDAYNKAYEALRIIDEASTRLNNKQIFVYRNDIGEKEMKRAA